MDLNLAFWLSVVLAASSCFGLLLAGRGRWQGWAVGLATQPIWAWFAIVTKSYGLLLVGVMYTSVYAKNLWKWRKEADPFWKQGTFVYCPGCRLELVSATNRLVTDTDYVRYYCGDCCTVSVWDFDFPVPILVDSFYSDPNDWMQKPNISPNEPIGEIASVTQDEAGLNVEFFVAQGLDMTNPKNNTLIRNFLEWRKKREQPSSIYKTS